MLSSSKGKTQQINRSVVQAGQAEFLFGNVHFGLDIVKFGHISAQQVAICALTAWADLGGCLSLWSAFVKGLVAARRARFGQAVDTGGMAQCLGSGPRDVFLKISYYEVLRPNVGSL